MVFSVSSCSVFSDGMMLRMVVCGSVRVLLNMK